MLELLDELNANLEPLKLVIPPVAKVGSDTITVCKTLISVLQFAHAET